MSLGDQLRTVRAAWPLLKRAVFSGQLFKPRCELTEPHPDVLCEYNVKIPIAVKVSGHSVERLVKGP